MCTNNWTVNTGAKIVANNKLQKSKEIYCCNKLVEYRKQALEVEYCGTHGQRIKIKIAA